MYLVNRKVRVPDIEREITSVMLVTKVDREYSYRQWGQGLGLAMGRMISELYVQESAR